MWPKNRLILRPKPKIFKKHIFDDFSRDFAVFIENTPTGY